MNEQVRIEGTVETLLSCTYLNDSGFARRREGRDVLRDFCIARPPPMSRLLRSTVVSAVCQVTVPFEVAGRTDLKDGIG